MMTIDSIFAFFRKNARLILPFMLSTVLSMALYAVYLPTSQVLVWTLPIVGINLVLFAFCSFVKEHNFIGGVIMGVIVLLALMVFFKLIAGPDYGLTFQKWLLTGSEQVDTRGEYLLALLVSFVPFFSVVVFYFTDVLYRMMFLTLLSIVPCALYVKVLSEIGNIYLCFIALLNVVIFLVHSREVREQKSRRIGTQAAVLSAVIYVFVLLVVSSAIPKESDTRFYDRFEELFMDTNFQAELKNDYTHFSDISGDAGKYRGFSNRRMYTVGTEHAPYFKRQTFDFFDFDNHNWNCEGSDSNTITYTVDEWTELHSKLSLSQLQTAIKRADQLKSGFADKYGMKTVVEFEGFDDSIKTAVVTSENFSAMYYLSPARIVGIRNSGSGGTEEVRVTKSGVFRFISYPHPKDFTYYVNYYDEMFARNYWFSMGGSDITPEDEDKMLAELYTILSDGGEDELADSVQAFISIREEAYEYQRMTRKNSEKISDEISELAHEITDKYDYEWEKANALAIYFITNDYRYDLNYVSPDDSPEYFLFTSRRGSCSDYAAAYVLMARSVGLNARYCEGFSTDPSSRLNTWIIKDSNSHAYPEVFIPNIGWTVFEPTVSSEYNTLTEDTTGGALAKLSLDLDLVAVVIVISGLILLAVIFGVALLPVISENIFMNKLAGSEPDEIAVMAYERMRTKAGRIVRNADSRTAYELSSEIDRKTGSEFTPVSFLLERIVYGGGHADQNDKKNIIDRYTKVCRAIKTYIRNSAKAERKKYR